MRRGGKAGLIAAGWLAGALPVLADDLPEKLAPCLACHGLEGQSVLENVPSLGAQTAPYALIQLFMFREKMRVAEPMTEAAQGLSDGDLQAMSDALATQPPPKPPDDPGDPTRLERARAVTEQHRCNFCHRPDYSGQQSVPRLADRGPPVKDLARVQERRAARLRADHGRGIATDRRFAAHRIRLLSVAPALRRPPAGCT